MLFSYEGVKHEQVGLRADPWGTAIQGQLTIEQVQVL